MRLTNDNRLKIDTDQKRFSVRYYINFLALTLFSLLISAPLQAKDVVFGIYDEFTLHNHDEGPLKDDVLLIFHGFGSAMPNGAYYGLHNAYSEHYSVIGFNYDYFDLEANDEAMDLVWEQVLAGRNVTFAGTSLGGFWANYYAEKYGVPKLVMVNPVVDPVSQLRQFIGNITVEKRNKVVLVTSQDIDRYIGRVFAPDPGISRLILLSRDDSILEHSLTESWYDIEGTSMVVFDEGGHTLNLKDERYIAIINEFLLPE